MRYAFTASIWIYPGESAAWHFVTLPADLTEGIKAIRGKARGWGSLRVQATIGASAWRTSIFPSKRDGAFILPLKAEVRAREGLRAGDEVAVTVEALI